MKKFLKITACSYACIVVANALELEFHGNQYTEDCNYIQFDVASDANKFTINRVWIDEKALEQDKTDKEVTLVIPGDVCGKQVCIENNGAFSQLQSNYLKLKVLFQNAKGKPIRLPVYCDGMFAKSSVITEVDLRGVDTSRVESVAKMFENCINLKNLEFGNFDTSKVVDMSFMFAGCEKLASLDLAGFNMGNVTSMRGMFVNCFNLYHARFRYDARTDALQDMSHMFYQCKNLPVLDLKNFYTTNVKDMSHMFHGCEKLFSLKVDNFDTSNAEDMSCMFYGCKGLDYLELGDNFYASSGRKDWVFRGCPAGKDSPYK